MSDRPALAGVLETVLYYDDHDRTATFYERTLGLRLIDSAAGRYLFFRPGGDGVLLLFNREAQRGRETPLPPHGARGSINVCFRAASGEHYERWKTRLLDAGVALLDEVDWPRGRSFYFHDPDGNLLEIASADIWPR